MEKPKRPPAKRGDHSDIEGYDVHPNQKKEIANNGAPRSVTSRRASGGTFAGAYSSTYRSYRGLKNIKYYTNDKSKKSMMISKLTIKTPIAPPREMGRNIKPDTPRFRLWPSVNTTGYASNRR
jgi:hypothetical protein